MNNDELKNRYISLVSNEQVLANHLFKFSDQDWEYAKQFYNVVDYTPILNVGEPDEFNVKLVMDLDKDISEEYKSFNSLHKILEQYGPGDYQFGSSILSIRSQVLVNPSEKVSNPKFDKSLLTIK